MRTDWSVIVPALDEEASLPALLASLREQAVGMEVLVADGGSRDATCRIARRHGARIVDAPRGRASQMNAAAARAGGARLLFLHADTRLEPDALKRAGQALERPGVAAGCFATSFDSSHPLLWGGRWKTHLWVRVLGFAPGDHGLFLGRDLFHRIGGYPEVPILEDRRICSRLRGHGRLVVVGRGARASARRFHLHGPGRTYWRMARVLLEDSLGSPPERLGRIYHGPPG